MRKITYQNSVNGLSLTFSSDTPVAMLEKFDGNSAGAEAIVYKPIGLDGQKLISTSLSARTITAVISWVGVSNGAYSREVALTNWEQIQRVFVPGNEGVLTWTNGAKTRFIKCRTAETPNFSERLPFLLSAELSFAADRPLWYDGQEIAVDMTSGSVHIDNTCGLAVPFKVTAQSAAAFSMASVTAGAHIAFGLNPAESGELVIDTENCTAEIGGELCNRYLTADSEFFWLLPGANVINCAGTGAVTLTYRNAYMGVG